MTDELKKTVARAQKELKPKENNPTETIDKAWNEFYSKIAETAEHGPTVRSILKMAFIKGIQWQNANSSKKSSKIETECRIALRMLDIQE